MPLQMFRGRQSFFQFLTGPRSRRRGRIPEQTELGQCRNAVIESIFLDDFAISYLQDGGSREVHLPAGGRR